MENRKRVFDDAARVAGGALGTLSGIRREVEGLVRHQLDRLLSGMDRSEAGKGGVPPQQAENRRQKSRLKYRLAARRPTYPLHFVVRRRRATNFCCT